MPGSGRASAVPVARPRPGGVLSLLQLLLAAVAHFGFSQAAPLFSILEAGEAEPKPPNDPQLWLYLGTAIFLVLLGGVFAGLTIALMGQDEVYLRVIAQSGEGSEKRNAIKVLKLLENGKHWVLVTLLISNVITNETLPIVLDRSIGGGYAAAISSTVLVIVFGEIVPQSICVRFGLPIGAWMSHFVLVLMWLFCPITWPIAKLLDHLLGEDHGTVYKKAGLKTLVTLHRTMGDSSADRLNEDEVAIISGVLDLKAKSVGTIMTPMNDVFVLSADAVLDEEMMDEIMREGYSRIPIHEPKNRTNFVGMLLVKMLITYDPEDARRVRDFSLATLPETDPRTSCLDIINFFQEGKSHMVLVSDFPGEDHGALGVVTLEDVIEELIGEEIIDESDVFIDVHKAIRRLAPAPTHRARLASKGSISDFPQGGDNALDGDYYKDDHRPSYVSEAPSKRLSISNSDTGRSPRATTLFTRRKSSASSPSRDSRSQVRTAKFLSGDVKQHLKHLGPSNAARQPKSTRINTVKVKPGVGTIPEGSALKSRTDAAASSHEESQARNICTPPPTDAQEGIGRNLVSPGKGASDGVKAVQQGYGSMGKSEPLIDFDEPEREREREIVAGRLNGQHDDNHGDDDAKAAEPTLAASPPRPRANSDSTIGSLHATATSPRVRNRGVARSGSITESFVDHGGVKKLVLETTSSSEEHDSGGDTRHNSQDAGEADDAGSAAPRVAPGQVVEGGARVNGRSRSRRKEDEAADAAAAGEGRKKKRSKKKKRTKEAGGSRDENTPLLLQGEQR